MGGLLILIVLGSVMALTSFLAGVLPLSMTLSESQLRFISSLGIGILMGTSLIVIIPEGIEAVVSVDGGAALSYSHDTRQIMAKARRGLRLGGRGLAGSMRWAEDAVRAQAWQGDIGGRDASNNVASASAAWDKRAKRNEDQLSEKPGPNSDTKSLLLPSLPPPHPVAPSPTPELPVFYIGLALTLGFVLMFLIDRLPRHATDKLAASAGPTTRHISLDNLASSHNPDEDEFEAAAVGFLGSLAPTPRQSRNLATTTGLVIHAAADGIAMGASGTTTNMKLGLIIFMAIMIHKAPAAFGLTSVLLKQGLSKRAARGHLVVFSLSAPFGALATFCIVSVLSSGSDMDGEAAQWWMGMLLLFSGGTFLYVAMHAMQEDYAAAGCSPMHYSDLSSDSRSSIMMANGFSSYAERMSSIVNGGGGAGLRKHGNGRPQMRDTVATVTGMLLPLLTQFWRHH